MYAARGLHNQGHLSNTNPSVNHKPHPPSGQDYVQESPKDESHSHWQLDGLLGKEDAVIIISNAPNPFYNHLLSICSLSLYS